MNGHNSFFDQLEDQLISHNIETRRAEATLNISLGKGLLAHKANIDPTPLFERLSGEPIEKHSRLIAGYVSGVKHVLLEPARSKAREWTFVESAGGIVPSIEVDTFILGGMAASGETPWVKPLAGDLVVAYLIELNRGLRILSQEQFNDWQVSSDRVTSGARSLLFHKTRNAVPKPYEQFSKVHQISVGDEYDAARCLVLADVFYADINAGFRFTMPDKNLILFINDNSTEAIESLQAATHHALKHSDYPLSNAIFEYDSRGQTTLCMDLK